MANSAVRAALTSAKGKAARIANGSNPSVVAIKVPVGVTISPNVSPMSEASSSTMPSAGGSSTRA
jgi:hypothetical protein